MERERPGASVIAVTTPTCPNCRAMKPAVDAVAHEFEGHVALVALDAAADPAGAAALGVRGVPTYIARHGEAEVMRRVGRMSARELESLFAAAASGAAASRVGATDRGLRFGVATLFALAALGTGNTALFALAIGAALFGAWDLLVRR